MTDQELLTYGFIGGGQEYTAYQLKKVLQPLDSAQDVTLHNDVMRQIGIILSGRAEAFRRKVARTLIDMARENIHGKDS